MFNAVFHYNCWKYHSKFVKGDNVNRLDIVFERFDRLLHEIRADFIILHGRTNLNLEDAVGDWLLLPLGLPAQAVHLDGDDLVCEGIQVGILTPWLDFPDNQGLGNRSGLLLLGLGLLLLLLHSLSSGGISVRIFRKWIEFVLFSGSGSSWLGSLFLGCGFTTLALLLVVLVATLGSLTLGSASSSLRLLLSGSEALDVTCSARHDGQLAHLEEPCGSVGHSLAETSVEGESHGKQKSIESDDISDGKSITDKPRALSKLRVEHLDTLLDGLESIIVALLVLFPAEDVESGLVHVWHDSGASKGNGSFSLGLLERRVTEEVLSV